MLIYITNRKLPGPAINKRTYIRVKNIGQSLNTARPGGHDRIMSGIASDNHRGIFFYPRGEENKLFDSIDAVQYARPWLLFLHGFHQDPEETVEKARRLQEIHGVNVVLFSWPSHPMPIRSFDTDGLRTQLKSYALSMLFKAQRPSLLLYFLGEMKNFIADYKNNYEPARRNAERSTDDFYAALQVVDTYLAPRVKTDRLSLIVHSMGNYLMQRTLADHGELPIKFWNIVCHQADVRSANHVSWVPLLSGYAGNRLYVTVNVLDAVLAASNLLHRISGRRNCERLGQSVRLKPDGDYQGYGQKIIRYLDFTDGYGVAIEHEIFTRDGVDIDDEPILAAADEIDQNIVDLLGRIFRGESDRLPTVRGRSSASGFSMMPTLPMVYKPQWIVEDENLCDEGPDVDCFIRSLDVFEDPFKKPAEHIPELDDD